LSVNLDIIFRLQRKVIFITVLTDGSGLVRLRSNILKSRQFLSLYAVFLIKFKPKTLEFRLNPNYFLDVALPQ